MTQPPNPPPNPLLVPVDPNTATPQDFGFPAHPTALQSRAWAAQQRFLTAFAEDGIVASACTRAGVTIASESWWDSQDLYSYKTRKAWALREALGKLEAEAVRRGRDGVDKPVFYRGQQVGSMRDYSDNLLMFRVKRLDPAYKDNYDPRPGQQASIQITRIIIHGAESAQVHVQQGDSVAPELPAAQVVEGEIAGDEKAPLPHRLHEALPQPDAGNS